jgi:diacylglycerol kinase
VSEKTQPALCLFAFSYLSFEYTTDIFSRHYHWLLEYAKDHAEASAIFAAID